MATTFISGHVTRAKDLVSDRLSAYLDAEKNNSIVKLTAKGLVVATAVAALAAFIFQSQIIPVAAIVVKATFIAAAALSVGSFLALKAHIYQEKGVTAKGQKELSRIAGQVKELEQKNAALLRAAAKKKAKHADKIISFGKVVAEKEKRIKELSAKVIAFEAEAHVKAADAADPKSEAKDGDSSSGKPTLGKRLSNFFHHEKDKKIEEVAAGATAAPVAAVSPAAAAALAAANTADSEKPAKKGKKDANKADDLPN